MAMYLALNLRLKGKKDYKTVTKLICLMNDTSLCMKRYNQHFIYK